MAGFIRAEAGNKKNTNKTKQEKLDVKIAGTIRPASIFLIFNCQTPVY